MAYKIEFSSRAARDFKKLTKTNRAKAVKIKDSIADLAVGPRPRGVETLSGTNPALQRIRVGDFRVIYEIIEGELLVWVVRLGDRKRDLSVSKVGTIVSVGGHSGHQQNQPVLTRWGCWHNFRDTFAFDVPE